MRFSNWNRVFLSATLLLIAGTAYAVVNIDTVPVGNPGNPADSRVKWDNGTTSRGAVDYNYRIGKFEVTNTQYCEFLNAKAKNDTYGLYYVWMGLSVQGGIVQSGSSSNYSYSVKPGYENLPVIDVCFYDAVRYANWMTNGQGNGDTESGSYAISGGGPNSGTVSVPDAAQRAAWAAGGTTHWLLPSENEWYKAAFHKNDGVTGNYWSYATRSNVLPYSDNPASLNFPSNSANYNNDDGIANGYNDGLAVTGSPTQVDGQVYLTNVGAYSQSPGPYGTYDQAGNVMEWNDALIGSWRGISGGCWSFNKVYDTYTHRFSFVDTYQYDQTGFRLVSVPEPSTFILLGMGFLGGLVWSWRRKF